MEGLIFDIKHYAIHDGPGIRQTVFFKGCPLTCWWCHNPESQSSEIEYYTRKKTLEGKTFHKKTSIGYTIDSDELFEIIKGDTVFFDDSGGGVTFSGGEPMMQPDFLQDMASKCKEASIHTALDTCGHTRQENFIKILPYIDLILFDLKIIDDELHQKYTGVSNKHILENLEFLVDSEQSVKLRFPIIPGITNTTKNLEEIKAYINKLKNVEEINILPYHDISRGKYTRFNKEIKMEKNQLKEGEDQRIKAEFETLGLKVKIGG
jgi:pyruvate formate lyase activating enzyme